MEILTPLLSFLGALGGGYFVWFFKKEDDRYIKLYGPLKFELKMMQLTVSNRDEILEDIKEWGDVNTRIDLMQKHMRPMTKKWLEHRDKIRKLFEDNPGLIKEEDFELASDFIDGCIKREITEEGQNHFAINENRISKLMDSIKNLQDKLL